MGENKDIFKCGVCGNEYDTYKGLKLHRVHGHKDVCEICGKDFSDVPDIFLNCGEVLVHKKKKHPNRVRCDICKKKFENPLEFRKHAKKEHEDEVFCDICGNQFKNEYGLKMHMIRKHNKKSPRRDRVEDVSKLDEMDFKNKSVFDEKLGHYLRSPLEREVAYTLYKGGIEYRYESMIFNLDMEGDFHRIYMPDFLVGEYGKIVVEPHQSLNNRDKKKFKIFMNQYPEYIFIIIGTDSKIESGLCDRYIYCMDQWDLITTIKNYLD